MRILQVHNRYRLGGGEDSVVEAERLLLERSGHAVCTLTFRNPSGAKEATRSLLRSSWNRSAADRVLEKARRFGADVVHVHNTWFVATPAVFRFLDRAGLPTVATMHNYRTVCANALLYRNGGPCELCVGHFPWRGVVYRCYRSSATQSAAVAVSIGTNRLLGTWELPDVVIALTDFSVRLIQSGGIPSEAIVVKPNFVNDPGPRHLRPSASSKVVFVGRLSEEKGVTDLVEAWGQADTDGLQLQIFGDGPLCSEIEERAASAEAIEVVGRVEGDRVLEAMHSARALALPSRWYEGMPMVLLEALSAGLGVVVSGNGGLADIAGDAGLSFEAGSVKGLAERLSALHNDNLVDSMGFAARTRYENRFNPAVGLEGLEKVYRLAISRSSERNRSL